MAIEYFLKLNGVPGESQASKHKDEIEVTAWSAGVSNPHSILGSGLSAGKASASELTITKIVDKASPKLLELCNTGKHIDKAVFVCCKSTGDKNPAEYLTIELEEIAVSSFQMGGSRGDEVGSESFSLAFGKISYDYKIQDKTGKLTSAGKTTHDYVLRETS
jgi:type VI secretion system secreted protein Hcp